MLEDRPPKDMTPTPETGNRPSPQVSSDAPERAEDAPADERLGVWPLSFEDALEAALKVAPPPDGWDQEHKRGRGDGDA